jgi:hypothetical protein
VADAIEFQAVTWGPPVNQGVSRAQFVQLQAIAKVDHDPDSCVVGVEWICARLAQLVALPAPPPALTRSSDGRLWFVCLQFGDLTQLPAPVVPPQLVADHPEVAAGIIAFDAWIANADRHAQNLAYVPGKVPPVIFDHGHAFAAGGSRAKLTQLPSHLADPAPTGCLVPHLSTAQPFGPWLSVLTGVPSASIQRIAEEAVSAGALRADEAHVIHDYLVKRQSHLSAALRAGCSALTDWGIV